MELFAKTEDALTFALRYSSQQYAQTGMSKLLKSARTSSGKGLVSIDGAGQAGMILARLDRMEPLERACIIARYSAKTEECPCCGNPKPLDEYKAAIGQLADWCEQFISSSLSARRVRYAIIQDYFERKRSIGKTAEDIGVPRRTAYDQKAKIWPPLTDLDKRAQESVGDMLAGICGEQCA